jgi:hypothetical protein
MNTFKIGDKVKAVKGLSGWFTIGQIGTVEGANERHIFVTFDNGREAPVKADEIELIESDTMKPFKIGDRVRAVKKSRHSAPFHKGWEGVIKNIEADITKILVLFNNDNSSWWTIPDEIELIESEVPLTGTMVFTNQLTGKLTLSNQLTPKPFPTYEEFDKWYSCTMTSTYDIYNYFAQFGLREVFPEVNKQYEFSMDGKDWRTGMLISYAFKGLFEHNYALYIRPISPTRLEQLKARRSELSRDELLELVTLMENGK